MWRSFFLAQFDDRFSSFVLRFNWANKDTQYLTVLRNSLYTVTVPGPSLASRCVDVPVWTERLLCWRACVNRTVVALTCQYEQNNRCVDVPVWTEQSLCWRACMNRTIVVLTCLYEQNNRWRACMNRTIVARLGAGYDVIRIPCLLLLIAFYISLFSALEQTHCALVACGSEGATFYSAFWLSTVSAHVLSAPYNQHQPTVSPHSKPWMRSVHVCLTVMFGRMMGILPATAVTRGWNGYRVSTGGSRWQIKFSRRFCRDSNRRPFHHESGAPYH